MVSSICSSLDIPKVVTFNTCVSPLRNKDEPWTIGSKLISEDISLMSVGDLPSSLGPPLTTLSLTNSLNIDLKANLIAFELSSSSSKNSSTTFSCNSFCRLLLSDLSVMEEISFNSSLQLASIFDFNSSE